MNVYKCARCREPMRSNVSTIGIQCEKCGSRIFYKERPNVKKVIKAR
ncbi:MAG: DNA-directed RNA polymerase subunit P [Thermoplasmata archaeon]